MRKVVQVVALVTGAVVGALAGALAGLWDDGLGDLVLGRSTVGAFAVTADTGTVLLGAVVGGGLAVLLARRLVRRR